MTFNTRSIRNLAATCAVAVVSLGVSACMTGQAAVSPVAMQQMQGMHYFAMATHLGEIHEAQLALTKATNPQVRDFAQAMIAQHTPALQREMQMASKLGAMPPMGATVDMAGMRAVLMANPYSRPVVEGHMQAMQVLEAASGMAFDRAYMTRQVNAHAYALENMDRMMAAMGHDHTAAGAMAGHAGHAGMHANMEMNANMTPMEWHMMQRAMVAMHLQQAQQMMAAMR